MGGGPIPVVVVNTPRLRSMRGFVRTGDIAQSGRVSLPNFLLTRESKDRLSAHVQ
jgi:hypothetical protein